MHECSGCYGGEFCHIFVTSRALMYMLILLYPVCCQRKFWLHITWNWVMLQCFWLKQFSQNLSMATRLNRTHGQSLLACPYHLHSCQFFFRHSEKLNHNFSKSSLANCGPVPADSKLIIMKHWHSKIAVYDHWQRN